MVTPDPWFWNSRCATEGPKNRDAPSSHTVNCPLPVPVKYNTRKHQSVCRNQATH